VALPDLHQTVTITIRCM